MAAAKGEEAFADLARCPEFGNGLVLPGDTELKESPGDTLSSILDVSIVVKGVAGVHNVLVAVLDGIGDPLLRKFSV